MSNEIFENLMAVITLFSDVKELILNDTGICKKNFEYVVDLCYRGLPNLKSLFIQCIYILLLLFIDNNISKQLLPSLLNAISIGCPSCTYVYLNNDKESVERNNIYQYTLVKSGCSYLNCASIYYYYYNY